MDIIYSSSQVPQTGGRKAVNPAFFVAPENGVTAVYINGNYPKIKAAYEEIGIPVLPFSQLPINSTPDAKPVAEGKKAKKGKR